MSSDNSVVFTKDNLDKYLNELGKEYRKLNKASAVTAEIILIGGAAILESYGFRDMTTDIDAVIHASSSMKDAVNRVGDKYNLPNGWLNSDFVRTNSYSPKLDEVSVYYKTFCHILSVRIVRAEYLIAMKLRSGRKYKNDLSDIIGILYEHKKQGAPITFDGITAAVNTLYGGWDTIPGDSRLFIEKALENENYEQAYSEITNDEKQSENVLIDFEQAYPGVTTESNVNDIIQSLKQKKPSVIDKLNKAKNDVEADIPTKKKQHDIEDR